jgi:hypothetical protein
MFRFLAAVSLWAGGFVLVADTVARSAIAACTQISTIQDLQGMSLSGNYCLAQDIEAGGVSFVPIGTSVTPFTGALNGHGYIIKNLLISSSVNYVGLFGYVGPGAVISDLGLTNVSVKGTATTGEQTIGALFGFNNQGQISNSYTAGSVSGGTGEQIGGFGGYSIFGSAISNSYSTASVTGGDSTVTGGFVAVSSGSISQSYATGTVSGGASSTVGGFAAANVEDYNQSGKIVQSFSTGEVKAGMMSSAGGFLGFSEGIVAQSYSTGAVSSGTGSYIGGFVGRNYVNRPGSGTIAESYSAGAVSGDAPNAIGAFVGLNSPGTSIANSYSDIEAYSFAGQNTGSLGTSTTITVSKLRGGLPDGFEPAVWTRDLNKRLPYLLINKGFPYLLWQPITHGVDYRSATVEMDLSAFSAYNGVEPEVYTGGTSFVMTYIGCSPGYLRKTGVGLLSYYNLPIVSIFERSPKTISYFTDNQAQLDVNDAVSAAREVGQPPGSAIYFTVDFGYEVSENDPSTTKDLATIDSYFKMIRSGLSGSGYRLGAYAQGIILLALRNDMKVGPDYTWLQVFSFGRQKFSGENIDQVLNSETTPITIGSNTKSPVDLDTALTADFGQWSGASAVNYTTNICPSSKN